MVPVGTLVQSFSAPRHHFGGAGSDRPSGWPALAGGRSSRPGRIRRGLVMDERLAISKINGHASNR